LGKLAGLRVDISDQIAVVELHALYITSAQGAEFWRWDGSSAVFDHLTRLVCIAGKQGVTLVCHQNDPYMLLKLPAHVLGSIQAGANVHFDMTPFPLHERLTAVLAALQAQAQAGSAVALSKTAPVPRLAADLADVADLLRQSLAVRDQHIAQQNQRLAQQEAEQAQLRHDFVWTQAQLDLLKDVMQAAPAPQPSPPLRPRRAPR